MNTIIIKFDHPDLRNVGFKYYNKMAKAIYFALQRSLLLADDRSAPK